jgi:hypothetical protein
MKLSIPIILTFSLLMSCNTNEKKYKLLQDIAATSLANSNAALAELSSANYKALNDKLRDLNYGEYAFSINAKATKLKTLNLDILKQIASLNFKGDSLQQKIFLIKNNYISDIISIDSSFKSFYKSDIDLFLFQNRATTSSKFNIEKAKNDILIFESKCSGYLNKKLGILINDYTTFLALVSQNKSHLKSGDTLEITAGIGSFSIAAKPTFLINDSTLLPNENAIAIYKLRVQGKGQMSMPVKIVFVSQDGQKKSKDFIVDYYVDN